MGPITTDWSAAHTGRVQPELAELMETPPPRAAMRVLGETKGALIDEH